MSSNSVVPLASRDSSRCVAASGDSDRLMVTQEEEVSASSIVGPTEDDCTQVEQTTLSRGSRDSVQVSPFYCLCLPAVILVAVISI